MRNLILIALLFLPGLALAGDDQTRETTEVRRADHDERDHESLRFLRSNRAFLRAQFDQLRLLTGYERDGEADLIDERLLGLDAMSREVAAARDTVAAGLLYARERGPLMSIEELAELEARLDHFDQLLVDQQGRLLTLEQDFLGEQKTALVVVVRGVPANGAPSALLLTEGDTTVRIALDAAQADALARGGVAQIFHEFVEPRAHELALRLEGDGWDEAGEALVGFDAPRDQLTFLELDLSTLDPADPASAPRSQVWRRQEPGR
jgi:hypothetical protein